MNIVQHLPYWHQGRRFVNRFEMKPVTSLNIEGWQHPNQIDSVIRPDGHSILYTLETQPMLHRVIGLLTLLHYQLYPNQRPTMFRDIYMYGWLDVVYGPYANRLFVPALTPANKIQWVDLNSGFTCLDYTPIRRLT